MVNIAEPKTCWCGVRPPVLRLAFESDDAAEYRRKHQADQRLRSEHRHVGCSTGRDVQQLSHVRPRSEYVDSAGF